MRSAILAVCLSVPMSCSAPASGAPDSDTSERADQVIVPGARIGPFTIGRDTLSGLLGEDTPEARKTFADRGIHFEFDRGTTLTAVLVTSSDYSTPEGLRVGSSVESVTAALGPAPPRAAQGADGKLYLPVVAYPGIQFMIENCRDVVAIRVGHE